MSKENKQVIERVSFKTLEINSGSDLNVNIRDKEEFYVEIIGTKKYVAKNIQSEILKGKPRFIQTEIKAKFDSPIMAREAVNFMKLKGVKCEVVKEENCYFSG